MTFLKVSFEMFVWLLLGAVAYLGNNALEDSTGAWAEWKQEHDKQYATRQAEAEARTTYVQNSRFIDDHNARAPKGPRVRLRMNQFGDLNQAQFAARNLMASSPASPKLQTQRRQWQMHGAVEDVPTDIDWRNHSAVSAVQAQGPCGGCYAFAAAGAMEGAWAIHGPDKTLVPLSIQNLLDCSQSAGNLGASDLCRVRARTLVPWSKSNAPSLLES